MLMGFHANSVNAYVGTHTAGHLLQRFDDIDTLIVDHFGAAIILCHRQAFGITIDGNHSRLIECPYALDDELTHWSTAPNCHNITRLNICLLCRHVSSGENVA